MAGRCIHIVWEGLHRKSIHSDPRDTDMVRRHALPPSPFAHPNLLTAQVRGFSTQVTVCLIDGSTAMPQRCRL